MYKWLKHKYYQFAYLIFFKGPLRAFKKLFMYTPFYCSKLNLEKKYIISDKLKIYFTQTNRLYFYTLGINFRLQNILNEYSISNRNILLDKSDLVIDCGANIGEFSIAIYKMFKCKKIYALEPDEKENIALTKNLNFDDCKTFKFGLSDNSGEASFYLNNETGDSSLIPSEGTKKIIIKTLTLEEFVKKENIEKIGLLKIEAEGWEPEIIYGAIPVLDIIKYITVDCSPERNGKSTFTQVNEILVKNNFELLNFNSTRMSLLFKNKLKK